MLRDVSLAEFDGSTRLFGRDYSSPLVIAPIGVQAQLHKETPTVLRQGSGGSGDPFTLSSATSRPMEKVFEEGGFVKGDEEGRMLGSSCIGRRTMSSQRAC